MKNTMIYWKMNHGVFFMNKARTTGKNSNMTTKA